jgi:signal transduction histidine kinase
MMRRSITFKIIAAFLAVSLAALMLVVVIARNATNREFKQYLLSTDQQTVARLLIEYYDVNGSWDSLVLNAPVLLAGHNIQVDERGNLPFTLADQSFRVILPGGLYQSGETLLSIDQIRSYPLVLNGQTIGYLDIRSPIPVPEPARNQFIERITLNLIYTALAALLGTLLLAFIVTRVITRPIRELTQAAQQVSRGNLTQQVKVRSKDEIGDLTRVFNEMLTRLNALLQSRRQMTADVAHELRTPLSIILGHAEGMHDGVLPVTVETVEIIRQEAIRLDGLVNDLRVLALSDAGELELHRGMAALAPLLEQAVERHALAASQKKVHLAANLPDGLPELLLDTNRMLQVFGNLLGNALRHTPAGGQITVSAARLVDKVEIRVTDSGEGIPPDELEKVFDRLYRTDRSRKREKGGSGLGLALARSLVEQHGGKIHAENAPGGGTCMVLWLPV